LNSAARLHKTHDKERLMDQPVTREILWSTPSGLVVDQRARRLFMVFRDEVGQGFVGRETRGWMGFAIIVAFVGLLIGTTIIFFNDQVAEADDFFASLFTRRA
jgi:hypothetical protein